MVIGVVRRWTTGVVVIAVAAGCALLPRDNELDEPTLTESAARQAATNLATALDDLGALFLVADPETERLQVLRWEDDPASAASRLAEQLALEGQATAFVRASAEDLRRRADDGTAVSLETRVTDAVPLGVDDAGVDWVRVDIVQDETDGDGELSSAATSYGIGVREGTVVDVKNLRGVTEGEGRSSAAGVAREFASAVLAGDEQVIAEHVDGEEVTDRDLATLRAWLAAAGAYEVAELPAAQLGSLVVAYVVPERGPLVRFDIALGAGKRGAAKVAWELVETE